MTRYSAPLPEEPRQTKTDNKDGVVVPGQTANTQVVTNTASPVVVPADNTTPQTTLVEPVYKTTEQDAYKASHPMPEQSTYTSNMEALKGLTPPLTDEERAKRQRAASAVESIGYLGNAANAIANLISVGNGARPQSLPQVDLSIKQDTWRKEMDAQRQSHAATLAQAKDADYAKYLRALSLWQSGLSDAASKDNDRYNRDLNLYRVNAGIADDAAGRVEAMRHHTAMEALGQQNADNGTIRANAYLVGVTTGGKKGNEYIQLQDGDGQIKRYRKTDWDNANVIAQMYQQMVKTNPDYQGESKKGYYYDFSTQQMVKGTPDKLNMQLAIQKAVLDGKYHIPSEYEIGSSGGGPTTPSSSGKLADPSANVGNDKIKI